MSVLVCVMNKCTITLLLKEMTGYLSSVVPFWGINDGSLTFSAPLFLFFQAVFSSVFYFASVPLYQGFLTIG